MSMPSRPASPTSKPTPLVVNLPSVSEALGQPGFDLAAWVGIFGPANMPAPVSKRLADELYAVVSSEEVKQKLTQMGAEPTPAPAEKLGPFVAQQLKVWGEKVKQADIQAE